MSFECFECFECFGELDDEWGCRRDWNPRTWSDRRVLLRRRRRRRPCRRRRRRRLRRRLRWYFVGFVGFFRVGDLILGAFGWMRD